MALEYPDIMFSNVDVDQLPGVSDKTSARAVPTFQAYLNGEKIDELADADLAKLTELVEKLNRA